MTTVAEKMTELNMTSCNAVARVAILEKRVTLNSRLVTHQEVIWPVKAGVHRIVLYEKGEIKSEQFVNQ